jgi:transposase
MTGQRDTKNTILQQYGALNPHPQSVTDETFAGNDFFDPCDIVQVKYEMLRRVRVEGQSVSHVASAFGFSRVAFYQIQAAYEEGGLPALIPKRRGPKHAHKLTDTVLGFIDRCRAEDETLRAPALATMIREQYGFSVHPRSIERAFVRRRKKGH